MKLYELSNPSDRYTFLAPSHIVATTVAILLGDAYMAVCLEPDDKFTSPFLPFSNSEELDKFFKNELGMTPQECMDNQPRDVAESLLTMLIATKQERETIKIACEKLDEDAAAEVIAKFHDSKRTSMNDIGSYAHELGRKMLEKLGGVEN